MMELPKNPNLTMVNELLLAPGRQTRPPKIAIILRGPPGSGKSYTAKLIKVLILKFTSYTVHYAVTISFYVRKS